MFKSKNTQCDTPSYTPSDRTAPKSHKKTLYKVYFAVHGHTSLCFWVDVEPSIFKRGDKTETTEIATTYDYEYYDNPDDPYDCDYKIFAKNGTISYYFGDVALYETIEVNVRDERMVRSTDVVNMVYAHASGNAELWDETITKMVNDEIEKGNDALAYDIALASMGFKPKPRKQSNVCSLSCGIKN